MFLLSLIFTPAALCWWAKKIIIHKNHNTLVIIIYTHTHFLSRCKFVTAEALIKRCVVIWSIQIVSFIIIAPGIVYQKRLQCSLYFIWILTPRQGKQCNTKYNTTNIVTAISTMRTKAHWTIIRPLSCSCNHSCVGVDLCTKSYDVSLIRPRSCRC